MGCGSGSVGNPPVKVYITLQATNSYVDSFPLFVIVKIKQKFDNYCTNQISGHNIKSFKQFYSQLQFNDTIMKNLFDFFVDYKQQVLKFRIFMIKYATILKCEDQTLSKILYEIYKTNSLSQTMSRSEYQYFITSQRQFFAFDPTITDPDLKTIQKKQFFKQLNEAGFYWKDFRFKFNLIDKNDIPFEEINKELIDNEINGLVIDAYYYVISTSWFERWSFYYQGQNHNVDQNSLKSTKLMIKDRKIVQRLSTLKKNRVSFNAGDQTYLIEQPNRIQFDDIEGEYQGQLKERLNPSTQCRFVTEKLWKLLSKMHPPDQTFRRKAISSNNLQLYPKTVYFYEAIQNGSINYKKFKLFNLGVKTKLNSLSTNNQISYFIKQFNEKNWLQVKGQKMLGQCTTSNRLFVVATTKRVEFIDKNTRKAITLDNLSLGDFVYADFPYQKQASGAFIMNLDGQKALIHYKGYSYRYETYIPMKQLSINQDELVSSIPTKKRSQFFQGLANIGNTCFINSTLQCLLATPILDQYLLQENNFSKSKSPLLYQISAIGSKLLRNQQASPYELKKAININLQAFSGNDQHDAQQFLGMILDKMNQQHKKKPTIFQELFGGKLMSTLTCLQCKNIKEINQNFYTLSLPIPQPQFLYYAIIVVPIYQSTLKKFYLKFHKAALVKDFIQQFQHNTGEQLADYVFVQMISGNLKKVRSDIIEQNNKKKLIDIELSEESDIYAFQKLGLRFYNELLSLKNRTENAEFVDYYLQRQKRWTIARIKDKKKEQAQIEIINSDNQIQSIKTKKQQGDSSIVKLGTQSLDLFYKKVFQRKYNSTLNKYEVFGIEYLVSYPKWVSYNDLVIIILRLLQNTKNNSSAKFDVKKAQNYEHIVRLLQVSKGVCIFCGEETSAKHKDKMCCKIPQKDIPIPWILKKKSYFICIDWISLQNYNPLFLSEISIDSISKTIQKQKNESKTNLIQCLNKFKLPEKVQMTCDKCKKDQQSLQTTISVIPNILILHMKQFRYTNDGHLLKIHIKLQWQQFLDITKYTINSKGNVYQLYAFVMHEGSVHGGHYTCTAKRKQFNQGKKVWVNFDDDITNILKQEAKNIDSAYLLFFKKVDMPTSTYLNFTDIMASNI